MADVFEVQDEIARKIAQAFRITLSPQEEAHLAQKTDEDLQAYDYFLRGGTTCASRTSTTRSRCSSRRWSAMATLRWPMPASPMCAVLIYELREKQQLWIDRGLAACERAMALDPGRAEVLSARARMYSRPAEVR
jgi:hypothetical protein